MPDLTLGDLWLASPRGASRGAGPPAARGLRVRAGRGVVCLRRPQASCLKRRLAPQAARVRAADGVSKAARVRAAPAEARQGRQCVHHRNTSRGRQHAPARPCDGERGAREGWGGCRGREWAAPDWAVDQAALYREGWAGRGGLGGGGVWKRPGAVPGCKGTRQGHRGQPGACCLVRDERYGSYSRPAPRKGQLGACCLSSG